MQSNQSTKTVRQANGWKSINNGVTTGGIFLALLPSQTTCASRSCRFSLAFASFRPGSLEIRKKLCLFYRLSLLLPTDGPTRDIIWETLDRKGVSCRMVIFGVNRCPDTHSLLFSSTREDRSRKSLIMALISCIFTRFLRGTPSLRPCHTSLVSSIPSY